MASKKVGIVNQIICLDIDEQELTDRLVKVVMDYQFAVDECENCLGSGISRATDRLCTACQGTGEKIPD